MRGLPDSFNADFLVGLEFVQCHVCSNQTAFDFRSQETSEFVTVMGGYSFSNPDRQDELIRKDSPHFDARLYPLMDRVIVKVSVLQGADLKLEFEGGGTLIVHDTPNYESYIVGGRYV